MNLNEEIFMGSVINLIGVVVVSSSILLGCGGGSDSESKFSQSNGFSSNGNNNLGGQSGSGTSTSGGGSTNTSSARDVSGDQQVYMDCNSLDSDKIYVVSRLSWLGGLNAVLANPENLSEFCVGFEQDDAYLAPIEISKAGRFVYHEGTSAYNMVQEPLLLERRANTSYRHWYYPEAPKQNDEALFTMEGDPQQGKIESVGIVTTGGDTEYYYIRKSALHYYANSVVTELYDFPDTVDRKILAVLPDGRALVGTSEDRSVSSLFLIDKLGVRVELSFPEGSDFYFPAKARRNPQSASEIWILAAKESADTGYVHSYRWSLDLTTEVLTVEGEYSLIPEAGYDLGREISGAVFTVSGKLWNFFYYRQPEETVEAGAVPITGFRLIERSLDSAVQPEFRIVMQDSDYTLEQDWDDSEIIQVLPESLGLVTGQ